MLFRLCLYSSIGLNGYCRGNSEGMHYRVCEECSPGFFQVTWAVCMCRKHKYAFKYKISTYEKKSALARCMECYTCKKSLTELDGRKFNPKTQICIKCFLKDKTCSVCSEIKNKDGIIELCQCAAHTTFSYVYQGYQSFERNLLLQYMY